MPKTQALSCLAGCLSGLVAQAQAPWARPTQHGPSVVDGQNDAQGGNTEDEHEDDEMILEHDVDAGIVSTLADQILVPGRDMQTRTFLRSQCKL